MVDGRTEFSTGPAGPTSHTYFSQRLRLHYLDWGNPDAPSLLLVHGNRDHAHNWDWFAERLRHQYHIVAVDLRGHGDSQWSTGSSYDVVDYVYDIAQLIHQQQLAPLRIVAHSLGGMVALRYSGLFPENVVKLAVVEGTGPPLSMLEAMPGPADRMRQSIESGRALAGRIPRRYESLDAAYARMQEANPHLSPEQARHLTIHGANQNEDGTYSWKFDNYVHTGMGFDLSPAENRQVWGNIECPVLLVYGAESWQQGHIEQDDYAASFADARVEVVEHAGHWVQHDQLDVFVGMVEAFLAS
ncbi:MAG TPA: alpha/beta hydrolase [Acidimicrobiia bacterium]|nr:alpha/beta hydrolase [Acidimicrobiia bacterium]